MRRFEQWTRCVWACALAAAIAFGVYDLKTSAQASPASLPLLSPGSLSYVGGFRVPANVMDRGDFSYGGNPVAFNPAKNSLFVGSGDQKVAEISIPAPVNSSDVEAMPFASYLQQAFVDPTEGNLRTVSSGDVTLDGLLVYGNRLYGSASTYYDANNSQRVSHFSRSLQLTQPSFSGWSQVWERGRSGFVSGMMATVPAEWQTLLGGPAVTGQCCIPIVDRTSFGPAAFAFNPAQVGQPTVGATPLLYYPSDHPTLGEWAASNGIYGSTTRINGMAIIAGTRTALFFGSNGIGPYCYGDGTPDKAAADASGGSLCYDPVYFSKGQHSYPYNYQVWAYDLNEFVAVKAGTKQPWDVKPYHVWPISFPTDAPSVLIGGVGYDAQRQTLYISQRDADGFYARRPIIHAFKLNATPGDAAPTTNLVSYATLTADKAAPQAQGTAITFTAQASGGVVPHQYKWVISNGTTSTVAADWTTSNRYTWTPNSANPNYRVAVWVRGAGNTADTAEATASMPFAVTGTGTTSSVTLTANRVAPQAPSTVITWTAVPVGGVTPHEYKWLVSDGTASRVVANWSTINTFAWTPSTASANYRVSVWVRSAGNPADAAEALASSAFAITAPGASVPPAASSGPPATEGPTSRVTAVSLSANKVQPQAPGTSITWTAVPSGGTAPLLYKWLVFYESGWTVAATWSSSNTFTWTPTVANSGYRVQVWVKSASNPADQPEKSTNSGFVIK